MSNAQNDFEFYEKDGYLYLEMFGENILLKKAEANKFLEHMAEVLGRTVL